MTIPVEMDHINPDQRISLSDSGTDMLMKLSEGNPGALRVVVDVFKGTWHDVPGFMLVLYFDSIGIYGSDIWMLYKDCCGEDMAVVERVIRGWQLGKLTRKSIHDHIRQSKPFKGLQTVDEMLAAI